MADKVTQRRASNPQSPRGPLLLAVASLVVAVTVGWLGERYPDVERHSIWILSVVAALFAFELGELHHRYSLSGELSRIQESQSDLATQQDTAHAEIAQLKAAYAISETFRSFTAVGWRDDMSHVAGAAPRVESTWSSTPCEQDLLRWKRSTLLSRLRGDIDSLASGDLIIDNPEKEIITNTAFLHDLGSGRVRAVSFQDEAFWLSDAGRSFLRGHIAAIGRGLIIERIFIVDRAEEDTLRSTIDAQKAAGIAVRIAHKDTLSKYPGCMQDFVLYDSRYVRYAALRPTSLIEKDATLSKDAYTIARFENYYSVLGSLSHTV